MTIREEFRQFLNEAEMASELNKELIVDLLNSYSSQSFKISNVKVTKNVSFQLDFTSKVKLELLKQNFNKSEFIQNVVHHTLIEMGLLINPNDIKVKDNGSNIKNSTSGGKSTHYVRQNAEMSVIVTTKLDNMISPESSIKLQKIIDKKISKLEESKKDPKTILYILKKLFTKYPKEGIETKIYSENGKNGVQLDPNNKFGDLNSNIISDIGYGFHFKSGHNVKEDPLKRMYYTKLKDFWDKTYRVEDLQFVPSVQNYWSKYKNPIIVVFFN